MAKTVSPFIIALIGSSCLTVVPTTYAKSSSEKVGNAIHVIIPATGFGMAMARHDSEGVKQLGKTMATNLAATYALKYATNDTSWGKRPDGDEYSFPSGHTSDACAGATFIGQRYGWKYGSLAMLPAAYVGWSRVEADRHHVRDVIAGCALGTLSGLLMTQPFDNTTVSPWYDNKQLGLSIRSTW